MPHVLLERGKSANASFKNLLRAESTSENRFGFTEREL